MPWTHELRRQADAPDDGTPFMAIPHGRADAIPMLWDRELRCFLGFDFSLVDRLACWWPMPANLDPLEWQVSTSPREPS